jgi:hypothetical protein
MRNLSLTHLHIRSELLTEAVCAVVEQVVSLKIALVLDRLRSRCEGWAERPPFHWSRFAVEMSGLLHDVRCGSGVTIVAPQGDRKHTDKLLTLAWGSYLRTRKSKPPKRLCLIP